MLISVWVFLPAAWARGRIGTAMDNLCTAHPTQDLPFVQGGGDRQLPEVGARALARAMPGAHLHEVPNGGHFAYFSCDMATQRRALQDLLSTALPA